ncbi:hypothetical protein [Frankia sp. Cr1]|uniref:hypothetical protein n=1 Tax=Frankia sp. Cr1 TaxID=3073931 RepID=UPI002AD3779A|nr:hypothetical protein [Frankia sp. Cr1]
MVGTTGRLHVRYGARGSYFLVVDDRRAGRLLQEKTFADRRAALAARFSAERSRDDGSDVEVVVLAATSHEALTKMDAR